MAIQIKRGVSFREIKIWKDWIREDSRHGGRHRGACLAAAVYTGSSRERLLSKKMHIDFCEYGRPSPGKPVFSEDTESGGIEA